ncbi:hypothetical protein C6P61_08605 [Malikia spinosa]|uniref:Transposase Tn5-like N-terminal domain-containing protein n=2 Tax=Malikia spinosa TaxID=86180 RepID=A0A2S9KEL8_9BURK|nr:hypothetical protein C6P61_08605 [Malikia spinosa]
MITSMTWVEQEQGDAPLGDARLSRSLAKLVTRLAGSPSESITQTSRGWAEMRAAYCFLTQDKLDWQDIMQPHWDATAQRMRQPRWCSARRTRPSWIRGQGHARTVPAPDVYRHAGPDAVGRDRCLFVHEHFIVIKNYGVVCD